MKEDIERILIDREEIKKIVASLGQRISADYKDKNPTSKYVIRPTCVLSYVFQQNNDY